MANDSIFRRQIESCCLVHCLSPLFLLQFRFKALHCFFILVFQLLTCLLKVNGNFVWQFDWIMGKRRAIFIALFVYMYFYHTLPLSRSANWFFKNDMLIYPMVMLIHAFSAPRSEISQTFQSFIYPCLSIWLLVKDMVVKFLNENEIKFDKLGPDFKIK